jgi:acyl-CoA synthetase (AMP-forming)/AMP-acid ligase II
LNLYDLIERHGRAMPHATAFVTPSRATGYAEAAGQARRMAASWSSAGVGPGDIVAVRLPNTPSAVLALLALARLGAAHVPLPVRRPADELAPLVQSLGVTATVATDEVSALPGTRWLPADDGNPSSAADAAPRHPGGDGIALVGLTSGTTGTPKAVAWTHRQLVASWEIQQRLLPFAPGARVLPLMGMDGNYPLQLALRVLLGGGTVVLTPGIGPSALFDAVDRLGATDVVAAPGALIHAMRGLSPDAARLERLDSLRVGGSTVSPALVSRLRRTLCSRLHVTYGSTETGLVATGSGAVLDRAPHAVGRLAPWVEAEAVDDDGRVLPRGERGMLRFRSDHFVDGYWRGGSEASVYADGWCRPGDIGRLLPDDTLVVEGRADDVINLDGTKVRPADVEGVLLQLPGLHEAAAYTIAAADGSTRLLAAVIADETFDGRAALAYCREQLQAVEQQIRVLDEAGPRPWTGG